MSFPIVAETRDTGSQRASRLLPPREMHQGQMISQWTFAYASTSHLRDLRSSCGSSWYCLSMWIFSSPYLLRCLLGEKSSVPFLFCLFFSLGDVLKYLVAPPGRDIFANQEGTRTVISKWSGVESVIAILKKKRRKKKKSVSVSLNIHQIRIGRVPSPCTLMENFLVWILNKMKYSVNLNFFEAWERSQIDRRGIGTPNVSISEDTYYQRSQC